MIADLKPYPAMKDSGVQWLGEVPEHWELAPNRTLLRRRKVLVGLRHSEYRLLSLTKQGVIVRDVETGRGKFSADMGTSQEVRAGDLVFCLFDIPETPRTVGLSRHDGMITGAYTVFHCFDATLAAYLDLYYRAIDDRKLLSPLYSGLRNTIPPTRFLGIKSPVPPPAEQAAIVRFLDYMDRRIRRYIRAKQKLIKLLEEQKQAIIHRAVTRGLDPNVRLKPSGLEWLGDVPEHWQVLRGKYVGRLYSTPSVSDDDLTENDDTHPMYLKVSDLAFTDTTLRLKRSKLYVKNQYLDLTQQERKCLVFPKRGGAIYTNKVGIVETECLLDPNLMGWEISDRFEPLYVALLLKTRTLADLADVSSVPQLNNKHIHPIPFPAPPRPEQVTILTRLDIDLVELNNAIACADTETRLLHEYRTRLIADVVTGKLDVREAAALLLEEIEELEQLDEAEDDTDVDADAADQVDDVPEEPEA